MPFGLQPTHLIIILVVALLIFGPSRLPEIGRSFGTMLREFGNATKGAADGFTHEVAPASMRKEEALTVPCKTCAKSILPGMKFCPECGAAQVEPTPS